MIVLSGSRSQGAGHAYSEAAQSRLDSKGSREIRKQLTSVVGLIASTVCRTLEVGCVRVETTILRAASSGAENLKP